MTNESPRNEFCDKTPHVIKVTNVKSIVFPTTGKVPIGLKGHCINYLTFWFCKGNRPKHMPTFKICPIRCLKPMLISDSRRFIALPDFLNELYKHTKEEHTYGRHSLTLMRLFIYIYE